MPTAKEARTAWSGEQAFAGHVSYSSWDIPEIISILGKCHSFPDKNSSFVAQDNSRMKNFGIKEALAALGVKKNNPGVSTGSSWLRAKAGRIDSSSPVDGKLIGSVQITDDKAFDQVVEAASEAFVEWRKWPAPRRGEVVRQIGVALRRYKEPLGKLVSYEMGKSNTEGLGEVQEMIDICDFAVGLSRQLHGLTMHSERPEHRM